MLRRIVCLLCALLLSACTLAPEETPAPIATCPACPTPIPITCPVCPTSAPIVITATALPATATPLPSATPPPTQTPTSPPALPEAPSTPEIAENPPHPGTLMPYILQDGTPALLQNFAHPELACQWQGVAGQALATDGAPVLNVVVVVSGLINGQMVELVSLTGSSLAYGEGGYEIELTRQPVESSGQLAIQLLDLDAQPLSDPVLFDTSADCGKNLALINFVASE